MTLKESLRQWRRQFKERMPYVRRREYKILQRNHQRQFVTTEHMPWSWSPAAHRADLHIVKPIVQSMAGEVCLFVSYAAKPELKHHVRVHLQHLLRAGLQVVLILNTDLAPEQFALPPELMAQLSGVLVRQNLGFDFAAWAHAYALCEQRDRWTRLYLVNDSIVGPFKTAAFDRIIDRIRASKADMVGLTENIWPLLHVQSFFLVFNATALRHAAVSQVFENTLSLPTKDQVIHLYEINLTRYLTQHGLRCEALFPHMSQDMHNANDTYFRWDQLVQAGFPYIKASLLSELGPCPEVIDLVPSKFLPQQPNIS